MTEKYTENERQEMEIENKLAYVCAEVYTHIPWNKINVKSAHKFFVDRIRASAGTRDFKEFVDTFTKKCNVDFVKIDTDVINFLDDNRNLAMNLLRKESVYIANLALEHVDYLKQQKKLREKGQTTL